MDIQRYSPGMCHKGKNADGGFQALPAFSFRQPVPFSPQRRDWGAPLPGPGPAAPLTEGKKPGRPHSVPLDSTWKGKNTSQLVFIRSVLFYLNRYINTFQFTSNKNLSLKLNISRILSGGRPGPRSLRRGPRKGKVEPVIRRARRAT